MNRRINSLNVTVFCMLQCSAFLISHAQEAGGIFHHLTTKNGLSSNRVNMVIQDRESFYWIATGDGLNRFDGSSCKVFRNIKNDSTSLSHNNCLWLLEDDRGDIWVATPKGVNQYLKKEGRFERHYLSHPGMLFDQVNTIRGMVKDEAGNIWIVSAGLWRYNIYSNQWTRYLHDPNDPASIPPGFHFRLQYDKFNKGLWMSRAGIVFFEQASGKFYHSKHNPENIALFEMTFGDGTFVLDSTGSIWFYKIPGEQLCNYSTGNNSIRVFPVRNPTGGIQSNSVDAENRIWFNHWDKTLIFDPAKNKFDTGFLAYSHQQSPLASAATHLYIDKAANYWISSSKGVSIYNPRGQGIKYFWLSDNNEGKKGRDNFITCLAEENENILWVGSADALFRYDLAQKKIRAIENLPLFSTYIRCLYLQSDSILWIGGWNELLLFDLRSEKVLKKITLNAKPQFITAGNQGQIWMGTWFNGLFEFSASGKLLGKIIQGQDSSVPLKYNGLTCFTNSFKEPCLWIGYNFENGFFKLSYDNLSIKNFNIPTPSLHVNTSNSVNTITEDRQGNLWLGTGGGGLVYFNRKNNSFTTHTQSDGLKSDYINRILLDDQSNAWVSTPNGISIIDGGTNSIINTEIDLTFGSNDFVTNGIRLRNGKFLFFSGLKMVEIDPVAYLQSAYPSRILLSSFKIFENEASFTENKKGQSGIKLSHRQNFFSFEYSLLKVNPQSGTQYAYRLDGFDKDWNNVRERRTAYYTNVPPGNYEFMVKATDESGKWVYNSSPVVITISPPFWKTWWFYLLCGFVIAGSVIYVVRRRVSQIKKRQKEELRLVVATQEQEKKNISAELHDDLGVRLSALKYFVTSLKDHLQPGNPLATETYNKTIEVIDESVEDIRYLLVNLSPKTLNEYGYLTAVEDLVNKLRKLHIIDIDLRQKGIEQRLPADMEAGLYRITQELINNTLKHAGASAIHLNIEKTDGFIRLQYTDNGKGFDPSEQGQGYGLQNIHTRVALLNGRIEWETGKEKSTRVTITVPSNHT